MKQLSRDFIISLLFENSYKQKDIEKPPMEMSRK